MRGATHEHSAEGQLLTGPAWKLAYRQFGSRGEHIGIGAAPWPTTGPKVCFLGAAAPANVPANINAAMATNIVFFMFDPLVNTL